MADRDPSTGRFAVGNSGGGRPKGWSTIAKMVAEATSDGRELVEFALATFRDPERTHGERMAAHAWLSDRGYGRPVQATEIYAEVSAGVRPNFGAMTIEERIAYLKVHRPDLDLQLGAGDEVQDLDDDDHGDQA
jgi:hypothetical protein